jgi:hypothetical protein
LALKSNMRCQAPPVPVHVTHASNVALLPSPEMILPEA